jgi:transcriptional regulator
MYRPPAFAEDRLPVLHDLIRAHPLGLLVTGGPRGLVANAVPFTLADGGPCGTLRAHLARANDQAEALREGEEALVVFQGPQAYVSPSFYPSKREHGRVVPTWNYVVVQARGRAVVTDDAGWLREQIGALTEAHEGPRAAPWAVDDAPAPFVAAQVRAIVGVEIAVERIEGKWKASQNRPEPDRAGVAEGLRAEGSAMAALIG